MIFTKSEHASGSYIVAVVKVARWSPPNFASKFSVETTELLWRQSTYSSVTQPSDADFTFLMYLYSVPRFTL